MAAKNDKKELGSGSAVGETKEKSGVGPWLKKAAGSAVRDIASSGFDAAKPTEKGVRFRLSRW